MKTALRAIIIIFIELAVIAGLIVGCIQFFPDKGEGTKGEATNTTQTEPAETAEEEPADSEEADVEQGEGAVDGDENTEATSEE